MRLIVLVVDRIEGSVWAPGETVDAAVWRDLVDRIARVAGAFMSGLPSCRPPDLSTPISWLSGLATVRERRTGIHHIERNARRQSMVEYRDVNNEREMPTSHFCKDRWRDGPVAECPRHQKLSKPQTNVYKGIGEPGGRNAAKPPSSGEAKPAAKPAAPAPKAAPSGGSGSSE